MTDPTVVKIQQARRLILESFNMMYPTALRLESVYRVCISIDPTYQWHLFEKDVFYLKEKGYLEFVGEQFASHRPFNQKTVKLTTDGKDIADRTRIDEALEI